MYIAYNIKNHRVIATSEKPFVNITENVAVAECNEIPEKYDYLLVDNVKECTRIIKEAHTQEVIDSNEVGEEIIVLEEIPAEMETYIACDLIPKFYEYTVGQLEKQNQKLYKQTCKKEIAKKIAIEDELKIMRRLLASINPDAFTDAQARIDFLDYNIDVENCILEVSKKFNR